MLSFASSLGDLGGLASAGAGIAGLFRSNKPSGAEKQMMQRQANIDELNRALQDPNHAYNKYLVEQETQLRRDDTQTYLRDLMNANQRASLMGRQTVFDPERRDEAINQYLSRSSQEVGPQARLSANNRILQAIQQNSGSMAGLNNLATLSNQRTAQKRQDTSAGFSGINKILQAVGGQNNAGQNYGFPGGSTQSVNTNNGLPWQRQYLDTSGGLPWQSTV